MAKHPDRAKSLVTTTRALIELLAKRGSRGEVVLRPDGTRALDVICDGAVAAVATHVAFIEARDAGWLSDCDGAGVHWTLHPVGRAMVRRLRSQGGEASAPSQYALKPPSKHATPMPPSAHVNPAESPLAWLRRHKDKAGEPLITALQYDAGERLRSDFTFAAMGPRVTANWSATGSGGSPSGLGVDIRDSVSDAQQRVRLALTAVGPISAGVLIDVCGHLKGLEAVERARGWPPRSGKIGLMIALSELARHYGLDRGGSAPRTGLSHWGASDYRPLVDGGGPER